MRVNVVRPGELSETEFALWRQWQEADTRLANPFLTPEFIATYARHRPGTRVAVVEENGDVAAFLPFEKEGRWVGRTIGHRLVDSQAMICAADYRPNIAELLSGCGVTVFEFDHLIAHQAAGFSARPLLVESPLIRIDEGWEPWLAQKLDSSSRVKRALAKRRKLGRELGEVRFEYDTADHAVLELLMAWKSAQYARTGRADGLARPWLRELLHDLVDTRNEMFSTRLSRLVAGDRTVALHLCVRTPRMLASWFPAYDTELGTYSPGLISLLGLVEAAAGDGITSIDLGKGHEDYKQLLKNADVIVGQGYAERRVPSALWRRIQQAPRRAAFDLVNRSPRAFRAADVTVRKVAQVRSALTWF